MNERAAISPSSPACPSEAVLDAYALGELNNEAPRAHIDRCPHCRARLDARAAAFAAMPRRDELIRAIHVAVAAGANAAADPAPRRWPRWRLVGALAAVSAAAVVLLPIERTSTRLKGGVGLTVYVERGGRVARAQSGDVFRAGERLRFEIDLPEDGHIMIVGREVSGRRYNVFPVGDDVVRSRSLPVGADQLLPGAVVLDEALGQESLFLVSCPQPFDSSQVRFRGGRASPPAGCLTAPFVLTKVAP